MTIPPGCDEEVQTRTPEVLVFLQNAWGGVSLMGEQPWYDALRWSPTGRRLGRIFGEVWSTVRVANASPEVGRSAVEAFPPDPLHILGILDRHRPSRCVLACGRPASEALAGLWPGPLVAMPHPAYRLLTNELLDRVKAELSLPAIGRVAFAQGRGHVAREPIPAPAECRRHTA